MISATGTLEATGLDVTVQFRDGGHGIVTGMTPGTFVANSDSTITIPQAGSQEVTITTTAIANTDNQDITITLAGTGATYDVATGAAGSDTLVAKNNTVTSATRPRLAITADSTDPVGANNSQNAEFTITATPEATGTITVYYDVSEPGDFVTDGEFSKDLSTAGTTTAIAIPTSDPNTSNDADTTLTVTILDRLNYTLADSTGHIATATINDDADQAPVLTVRGVSVSEGEETADINFTLDKPAGSEGVTIEVAVNSENSTATESDDFTLSSTTVSIASGESAGNITVSAVVDQLDEADEEFELTLTVTGATFSDGTINGKVVNTITDNDDPPVVSVNTFVAGDGVASTANFVVTLSPVSGKDVEIAYAYSSTSDATSGTDFNLGAVSPLVIDAGETTGMIPISILADNNNNEGAETIVLSLTATNAVFDDGTPDGSASGTATGIITDEPLAFISTIHSEVADTDYFTYTVTLNPAPTSPVTVNLTNGTFPLGNNATSSINFRANESSKTVTVDITETYASQSLTTESGFTVTIASGTGYTSVSGTNDNISVRIKDGRNLPTLNITSLSAGSVRESNAFQTGLGVTGTHTGLDIHFEVTDTGTVTGFYDRTNLRSIDGGHLVTSPYSLASGASSVTFVNWTTDRSAKTGDGGLKFAILPGAGYKLGGTFERTLTVTDNQIEGAIVRDATVREGSDPNEITIESYIYPGNNNRASVNWSVDSSSTAISGTDYRITTTRDGTGNLTSGNFVLSNSNIIQTLYIHAIEDNMFEGGNETIVINYSSPDGTARLPVSSKTYTITEKLPIITLTSDRVATGVTEGYAFDFTVSTDTAPPVGDDLQVTVNAVPTTVSSGIRLDSSTVTFTNSITSVTRTVTFNAGYETSDRNAKITISVSPQAGKFEPVNSIEIAVKDNENIPSVRIERVRSQTDQTVISGAAVEGDRLWFRATMSRRPNAGDVNASIAISETINRNFLSRGMRTQNVQFSRAFFRETVFPVFTGPDDGITRTRWYNIIRGARRSRGIHYRIMY